MAVWLPGVQKNRAPVTGGSFLGPVEVGVVHTTESSAFHPGTSYFGHSSWPHFTVIPSDGLAYAEAVWQHIPLDRAARALQNRAGGVQTNREGVVQIEVVARAAYPGWSRGNGQGVANLRRLMRDIEANTDIPSHAAVEFVAYPASYGVRARQRMTDVAWVRYQGWCGHQHVPENDHGDPGAIDINNLLAGDDDMPLSDEDVEKVADAAAKRLLDLLPKPIGRDAREVIAGAVWSHILSGPGEAGQYAGTHLRAARDGAEAAARAEALLMDSLPSPPDG